MPEYTDYAKIKIPLWSEPDQVPVDLKDAFTTIDALLVLKAANTADRDAKYGDVPTGTIVTGTDTDAIWRKTETGWQTIWYDTGWLSSGIINAATNVTIEQQRGRIVGGHASLAAQCIWTGDPFEANSVGDLANRTIAYATGDFRPPYNAFGLFGMGISWFGGAYLSTSDGSMVIANGIPNATIESGTNLRFNFEYGTRV